MGIHFIPVQGFSIHEEEFSKFIVKSYRVIQYGLVNAAYDDKVLLTSSFRRDL